jgi:hypothetical protein
MRETDYQHRPRTDGGHACAPADCYTQGSCTLASKQVPAWARREQGTLRHTGRPRRSMGAGFENEMCLTGNCSSARHVCALPPRGSWLADYVPSIMKVCQCPNITMAGRGCNIPCPGGHSNPCSGHGECLYGSGTCVCDFGWQGDYCCDCCSVASLST